MGYTERKKERREIPHADALDLAERRGARTGGLPGAGRARRGARPLPQVSGERAGAGRRAPCAQRGGGARLCGLPHAGDLCGGIARAGDRAGGRPARRADAHRRRQRQRQRLLGRAPGLPGACAGAPAGAGGRDDRPGQAPCRGAGGLPRGVDRGGHAPDAHPAGGPCHGVLLPGRASAGGRRDGGAAALGGRGPRAAPGGTGHAGGPRAHPALRGPARAAGRADPRALPPGNGRLPLGGRGLLRLHGARGAHAPAPLPQGRRAALRGRELLLPAGRAGGGRAAGGARAAAAPRPLRVRGALPLPGGRRGLGEGDPQEPRLQARAQGRARRRLGEGT